MRAKRKLIRISLLNRLAELFRLGVPLAKIIRDFKLDISIPHLKKLISYYEQRDKDSNILLSLNPEWLNDDGTDLQEVPDNYKYTGMFPYGKWEKV